MALDEAIVDKHGDPTFMVLLKELRNIKSPTEGI
jgi:hypothetical protein